MRVLIISQYFWPEVFRINEVVATLVDKGVEVDVLTGKPNYPEGTVFEGYRAWGGQEEQKFGATIFRVPLFPRGRQSAWRLALNYISFVVSGGLLGAWLLRKRQYDAIFVYAPSPILQAIPGIFLAWLKRRKLAVWIQDLWPASLAATGYVRNAFILSAVEQGVRWIYRHADLLLVQSRAFESSVALLAPGRQIVYYPNSVEAIFSELSSPAAFLPEVAALEEGFPVVFAGNVGAAQAVEVIVQAAALLQGYPDIRFIIFGQGSRWDWMQEQVKTLGLGNLHLPGRFPVDTMPGLMRKAGALLVTLAEDPIFALTVPNKVQAYMAVGRPIVACLNGEGARLVEEAAAGVGVPAQDAEALAAAVLKLYRMSPQEREQLGGNGRSYFTAHFDHERLVDQLLGHLRALADATRKTS